MTTLPDWHPVLARYLSTSYGEPLARERLGGKSGAVVERVAFADTSVIVKALSNAAEARFYAQTAPALIASGVPVPRVEFQHEDGGTYWLVLEAIPRPLPREDWLGSIRVVAALARLHALDPARVPIPDGRFVPVWTDSMTGDALGCFSSEQAESLAPRLRAIQYATAPLFEPVCCISGDPNPTNWGVRDDSSIVLFDWERFTLAHPAVDLAICVGGLGSREQFAIVAHAYLEQRKGLHAPLHLSTDELTTLIARAKVWTVVEYLGLYTRGHLTPDATLEWVVGALPAWLKAMA